jgi:multiple antibiotic resistance protein
MCQFLKYFFMNWDLYINFLAAMLAILNPVGIWPMWSELTFDASSKVRKRIAFLVTGTAYVILVIFLLSGKQLLQFFSIDLEVFKIAGGILLLITGLSMVQGEATKLEDRMEDGETSFSLAKQRFRKIIVPIGIPMLAGPGSITTVVLYGSLSASMMDFVFMSGVVLITFLTLLIVFLESSFLEKKVDSIVFVVFTRVFGIMVTAIALQFMVEGLGEVFPSWMEGHSAIETDGEKP